MRAGPISHRIAAWGRIGGPGWRDAAGATPWALAAALAAYWIWTTLPLARGELLIAHDDAYINYVYSRNWATGDGLVFNPGERVWGYTSPAQVLLLGALAGLGLDLPRAAPLSGFAFACASGWLVFLLLRRALAAERAAALAALALVSWTPIFALHVTLEGNLLIAAQLLFLELLARGRPHAATLAGSASCLVRPDSVLLVVPALLMLREARRAGPLLLFALPGLAWFAFALGYYGALVPNTLLAKSGLSSTGDYLLRSSYFAFAAGFPSNRLEMQLAAGGWLLGAAKLGLVAVGARALGRCASSLGYAAAVYPFAAVLAYAIIGAPQHHWQIQSASFFFHLAAAAGAISLVTGGSLASWRRGLALAAALATLALVGHNLRTTRTFFAEQQSWLWRGVKYRLYATIAEWINANLPASARVASAEVGVLGYFSDGFAVIDDSGLVSPIFDGRGELTDERFLSRLRPDYVLLHGPTDGRRFRGRSTEPIHAFPYFASDLGDGLASIQRIRPARGG